MPVATEAAVSIDQIEDRLSQMGMETEYSGDDDGTFFTVSVGDKELAIYDAVSGGHFRPENLSSASYYFGLIGHDVTRKFEDVETVDEFIYAVTDSMSVDFMPR